MACRALILLALLLSFPLEAVSAESPSFTYGDALAATAQRGNYWALDVNLGYLHSFAASPVEVSSFFGRVGAGYLRSQDPLMIQAEVFVDRAWGYSTSVGVLGNVADLMSGFWGEAGLFRDFDSRFGAQLSGGWSLLGLELQARSPLNGAEAASWGAMAKLRIPVGMLTFLAARPKLRQSSN